MRAFDQQSICQMFDRISATYDLVNRLLSFGQDQRWRRKLAYMIKPNNAFKVLDIATGTGDLLMAIASKTQMEQGVGIDLAPKMLELAQKKLTEAGLAHKTQLLVADATKLPFEKNSFEVLSIAFGIRNVVDPKKALEEMLRVIKPGGMALILEFSLPANKMIKYFYLAYFRYLLPFIGGLISKEPAAYQYLNRSVEAFPYAHAFSRLMQEAGFIDIEETPLSLGIATIYLGRKA